MPCATRMLPVMTLDQLIARDAARNWSETDAAIARMQREHLERRARDPEYDARWLATLFGSPKARERAAWGVEET